MEPNAGNCRLLFREMAPEDADAVEIVEKLSLIHI